MAENSNIAWTDHTFNPWMGCFKVSAGCKFCYAEALTKNRMGRDLFGAVDKRSRTGKSTWAKVRTWNAAAHAERRPRKVFCASLADVFEDAPVPNDTRPEVWQMIRACPWLDFQLLTKRPENIAAMLPEDWGEGWPNVWLGTSIEDRRVVERARVLAAVPAAVRFISYEPAIGPVFYDFPVPGGRMRGNPGNFDWEDGTTRQDGGEPYTGPELDLDGIHWLICGGESGPGHRPMNLGWAQDAWRECQLEGVPFFFKQSASGKPGQGEDALGKIVREFPASWDRLDVDTHPVYAPEGSLL